MLPKILFLLALVFFQARSFADISRLRIIGSGGFGQTLAVSKDKESSFEGPYSFSASIDYMMNSRYDFGAEHMRSMSQNGTTVGLTGFTIKHFFWFSHPQILQEDLSNINMNQPVLQIKAWSPYIGGSIGFAQASLLDTKINAVGIYGNLKGGLDYGLSSNWGLRCEGNLAMTFAGTGSVQTINALLGFYIYL